MSSLTSTFDEWDWLLANPRFARKGSTIAWEGFHRRKLPFHVTPDHLVELSEAGQYSFQVVDGSIFQLTYQFDQTGEIVLFGSLGFYKTVDDAEMLVAEENVGSDAHIDDDVEIELIQTLNAPPPPPIIPWLRLDYDPEAARGVIHAASHLHVSLTSTVRLPVAGVPTPKQFVEAVMSWFYPDDYAKAHLDQHGAFTNPERQKNVNEIFCAITAEPMVRDTLHFMIPPSSAREAEE
jgi:hypothetical protein